MKQNFIQTVFTIRGDCYEKGFICFYHTMADGFYLHPICHSGNGSILYDLLHTGLCCFWILGNCSICPSKKHHSQVSANEFYIILATLCKYLAFTTSNLFILFFLYTLKGMLTQHAFFLLSSINR